MNVLNLAEELNLCPKRSASTHGGEFKSQCPKCRDGKDRFCIWPYQGESGRYWCRVCETKGDGIQFCRDFLGMTFQQACQKVGIAPQVRTIARDRPSRRNQFTPAVAPPPLLLWQQAAKQFIATSHRELMHRPDVLKSLETRGLTIETIQLFSLGWNGSDVFDPREKWGLAPEVKENGVFRRQWLPKGIVIPSYVNGHPVKIKIRRSEWTKEDTLPKYVEISGSRQSPSVYGDMSKPVVIVESELDAMLIQQSAAHLVCCVALGGVSKKPDSDLHAWLQKAALILLSLDFDEAGKGKYAFWMTLYPNLKPWPAPQAKSPGDAYQIFNMNILHWIQVGLSSF